MSTGYLHLPGHQLYHKSPPNSIFVLCHISSRDRMRFSEIKQHLSKFRVGIAGAGGLGSNSAIALARSGIGTLVIADFDIVEERNLNRQYYFTGQKGMLKTEALKENIILTGAGTKVE